MVSVKSAATLLGVVLWEPTFFYFDADKKKLYLHRVLDNRGLTPAYLRTQIETFISNLRSTFDLWKFTK